MPRGPGDEDNWLHAETIVCLNCFEALYRVDHSPFYYSVNFYCERCSNRAEVSANDPVVHELRAELGARNALTNEALTRAIESRLRTCDCGGHYSGAAPRRWYKCNAMVLQDAADVDLWPAGFAPKPEDHEPTEAESQIATMFLETHVRITGLWQ